MKCLQIGISSRLLMQHTGTTRVHLVAATYGDPYDVSRHTRRAAGVSCVGQSPCKRAAFVALLGENLTLLGERGLRWGRPPSILP